MSIAYPFSIPFCLEFAYQARGDHLMGVGIYPYPDREDSDLLPFPPDFFRDYNGK